MQANIYLTLVDYAILAFYFLFVLGIGFALKRFMRGSGDFFLSGRLIPAWVVFGSLMLFFGLRGKPGR